MAQKRKKNKKWIFWVIMIVLFVAAGAVCYLVWDNYFKKKEDKPIEEQSVVEVAVDDVVAGQEQVEEVVEKEKVVQYEGEDPNEEDELTGVVTYVGVSGESLMIRVNIDQYLDSGSCELSLIQNGVAYSDTTNIVGSAATATCEGFNVPVSGLSGNYEIVIKINSGGKNGIIKGEAKI